ncbi:MAG: hypothetical protein JJ879_00630 [Sneathiella sp.]|nr:hypothetical protein [Sneathiella sp.]
MNLLSPKSISEGLSSLSYFTKDDQTAKMIRQIANSIGLQSAISPKGDIRDAVKYYQTATSPDVLIVDVSGLQFPLNFVDDLAAVSSPHTRVIVLGKEDSVGLYRALLKRGVDDYLVTPMPEPLLRESLNRLRGDGEMTKTASATSVGILGTVGGAGCTSIAANLLSVLTDFAHRRAVGLDLTARGGMALLFGLVDTGELHNLIKRDQNVDDLILSRTQQNLSDRAALLGFGDDITDALPFDKLEAIGERLGKNAHYLLMDFGMSSSRENMSFYLKSDLHFLVLTRSLPSLKRAKVISDFMMAQGLPLPKLILNHPRPVYSTDVTKSEIERILDQKIAVQLPHKPRLFSKAEGEGRATVQISRRMRQSYLELSSILTGRPTTDPSLFGRLRGAYVRA